MEHELEPFQINYILKVNKKRIKRERYKYDQEAGSVTVSPPPPPPSLFFFFFGKCQNDKVREKTAVTENEGNPISA